MLTQHIALVPESGGVDLAELTRVSAALQKQVTRDLAPLWSVSATVDPFCALEDVPVGYWPIVLSRGELGREAGLHLDKNGQPYAQIGVSALWSLEASRACLELLINPFGDRTTTGRSLRPDQGLVEYLVEVTGPCASRAHGYAINGVLVSDFCTPAYYGAGSQGRRGEACSYNGALTKPWQLRQSGYLTWHDAQTNAWWTRALGHDAAVDVRLGHVTHTLVSARALAQSSGPARGWSGQATSKALESAMLRLREQANEAALLRAHRLRSLLGERMQESLAPPVAPRELAEGRARLTEHPGTWAEPAVVVSAVNARSTWPGPAAASLSAEHAWVHDDEAESDTEVFAPHGTAAVAARNEAREHTARDVMLPPALASEPLVGASTPPVSEPTSAAVAKQSQPPTLPRKVLDPAQPSVSPALHTLAPPPEQRNPLWLVSVAAAAAAVIVGVFVHGGSSAKPEVVTSAPPAVSAPAAEPAEPPPVSPQALPVRAEPPADVKQVESGAPAKLEPADDTRLTRVTRRGRSTARSAREATPPQPNVSGESPRSELDSLIESRR